MDRLRKDAPASGPNPAASPRRLGFRQPAEWAPHRATWLGWPHHAADWPGKIAAVRWTYTEIVRKLASSEQVGLLVQDERAERQARSLLEKSGADMAKVSLVRLATDRGWLRDTAPSFVKSADEVAAVEWDFNGWAKYPNHRRDRLIAPFIAKRRRMRRFPAVFERQLDSGAAARARRVVLEGGSIDLDGEGTLLTTEECLLGDVQARNPGLERADLEAIFSDYLAIDKVLWLGRGIAGDDTHGHVDDLARFVRPGVVVIAAESNEGDANYVPLRENFECLQGMTDASGRKIEVVKLPMPSPLACCGVRLPASYANFYIANDRVLVPTFNDVRDREALGLLGELFPGREVVGIHAVELVWGFGTLHCMTHEEPL